MTGTTTSIDVAVRAVHLVGGGTLDELREVVAPGAVNRESVAEPPDTRGTGPEAFFASGEWLRRAFSDLAFTVDDTVADGDLTVVGCRMSGRQTGPFVVYTADGAVERAFAPTGKRFEVRQAHFQRVHEGRVTEHWAIRDDQGLGLQLGWIPPSPMFLVRSAIATRRARRAHPG
ncbi:ester cyclase [Pseudonocardia sp. WMMC193]|uniref:ester cyclase n=1 Tax=Pseudonocardia sp. WMMC193 TaxID=2911965 RepID=UPI001F2A4AFA|nr:ester cyclase [Pseudonocardia sp. WMMC193]MCF7552854.1 ester cyclase [Pseudonocardia sp. WMMC193]